MNDFVSSSPSNVLNLVSMSDFLLPMNKNHGLLTPLLHLEIVI